MNILIIKLGAIGDVIRTTSILPGLRSKYEDCKIDWITKKESFDFLKNNRLIDNTYIIDDGIVDRLIDKDYDLLINLDDDDKICTFASEFNSKKIIGSYLKEGKKVYSDKSSPWFDMGLISKYGKQKADELKAQNKKTYQQIMYEILDLDYKKQEPILILNENEKEFGINFANKNNIKNELVIGINTGAGGRWQDKKLSIEETALLIKKLNNEIPNIKLLLFGGPEEKKRNDKIKNSVKNSIIDAGCDNSLIEFSSLVNLCNILITSDSLAMNIGIALKKKIVAFFYPTSSEEIELYDKGIKIIGKGNSYCSYQEKCDDPPKWEIDEIINAVKNLV